MTSVASVLKQSMSALTPSHTTFMVAGLYPMWQRLGPSLAPWTTARRQAGCRVLQLLSAREPGSGAKPTVLGLMLPLRGHPLRSLPASLEVWLPICPGLCDSELNSPDTALAPLSQSPWKRPHPCFPCLYQRSWVACSGLSPPLNRHSHPVPVLPDEDL